MGQCPMFIPDETNSSESPQSNGVVCRIIDRGCVVPAEVCTMNSIAKVTLAQDDEHRFLVAHEFDEHNLIEVKEVSKVFGRERAEYFRQRQLMKKKGKKIDDSKTEITTAKNSDKYSKENNPNLPLWNRGGAKDKLVQQYNRRIETTDVVQDELCAVCTDPFAEMDPILSKSNALHLTMKANLVDFYQTKYLEMFPDAPLPCEMKMTPSQRNLFLKKGPMEPIVEPVPNLTRADSQDSFLTDDSMSSRENEVCVRLERDGSSFLDLSLQGSLGKLEVEQSSRGAAPPFSDSSNRLVLSNRKSGEVIAVCALRSVYGPPVVRILSPKPRMTNQSSFNDMTYNGHTLYAWAEFKAEGNFPLPVRYSLSIATKDGSFEKTPRYHGSHTDFGSPNIKIVGQTEKENCYKGCCLLSLQRNKMSGNMNFSLKISRGVDPALFICLTGIVDELLETMMMHQYHLVEKKKKKHNRHRSKG